ncbi:hypothetical protein FGO68_gene463 [Halteria grandinella]|uniref:Major facilitator superfamily (MFS) profile domain-containing protein n=1 Tax=Halteria grandinella TaxID=5974 RepID=A0A8J8NDV3_HALGN|nr:hypothetical protein FGO68_gene463 [Halteria grandinella]
MDFALHEACIPQPKKDKNLEAFCGTDLYYQVDYSVDYSLHNWFTQLQLECVEKSSIAFIGMCFFLGWAFGSIFVPRLSDLYGRKFAFLGSMILQTGAMIGMNFSHSIPLTTALMFALGMCCVGSRALGFLYLMEMLPKRWQVPSGTILNIFDTSIPVLEVLYFWKISKEWTTFVIIFGECVGVLVIIGTLFLPESPKFLLTMKRYDEARKTINFFTQPDNQFRGKFDQEVNDHKSHFIRQKGPQGLNQSDISGMLSFIDQDKLTILLNDKRITQDLIAEEKLRNAEERQLTGSLKDLIAIRRHFINLCILLFAWIGSSFDYYLVSIIIKYLPGDVFVNAIVTNSADIPIAILAGVLYQFFGLKKSLFGAFILAALGGLSLVIFSATLPGIVPVMVLFAKGGVKMTFNICYFANSQIFPAIFAGTAFGICNLGAKIATIFSPYMAEIDPPLPMIIFTVLAVSCAMVSLLIRTEPEQQTIVKEVSSHRSTDSSKQNN